MPGVTTMVGDIGFPAALVDAHGQVVPSEDPRVAGHGWSSTKLLADARVSGSEPNAFDEIAVDGATAAAAGIEPGDTVQVVVNVCPATAIASRPWWTRLARVSWWAWPRGCRPPRRSPHQAANHATRRGPGPGPGRVSA
ncbi:hypothetical protein ACWDWU_11710 [Streptomyces sp. NPDC003442]